MATVSLLPWPLAGSTQASQTWNNRSNNVQPERCKITCKPFPAVRCQAIEVIAYGDDIEGSVGDRIRRVGKVNGIVAHVGIHIQLISS
jgi:hypothetical protein